MFRVCMLAASVVLGTSGLAWAGGACCGGDAKDAKCDMSTMATTQPTTRPAGDYVCPMGCATSDKPGKCPTCGMDLVKKDQKATHADHAH